MFTPLGDDTAGLLQMLVRLSQTYAVTLVSDDPAPADAMLANTFPVHPPSALDGAAPDRLLLLPGDDPHHTALAIQLSYAFAAIVVAGPRPFTAVLADAVGAAAADLLIECLLDGYGWQAATAARDGMAGLAQLYPLEPMVRARSVALLETSLDRVTVEMVEQCYDDHPHSATEACASALATTGAGSPEVARALAVTFAEERPRGLYLDVTTLSVFDAGTGIQRVAREITRQLGRAHEIAARVEPVRSKDGAVTLARSYGRTLYGVPDAPPAALPAVFKPGDVYVCLDFNIFDLGALARSLHTVRAGGRPGRGGDLRPASHPAPAAFPGTGAARLPAMAVAAGDPGRRPALHLTHRSGRVDAVAGPQPAGAQPPARYRLVPSRVRFQRRDSPCAGAGTTRVPDGGHGGVAQRPHRRVGCDGAGLAHWRRCRAGDRGPRRLAHGRVADPGCATMQRPGVGSAG